VKGGTKECDIWIMYAKVRKSQIYFNRGYEIVSSPYIHIGFWRFIKNDNGCFGSMTHLEGPTLYATQVNSFSARVWKVQDPLIYAIR